MVVKGSSSSLPGWLCRAGLALTQVVPSDRKGRKALKVMSLLTHSVRK